VKPSHIWQGAVLSLALIVLAPASAGAATPTGVRHGQIDVTSTPQGQKIKAEAIARYSSQGFKARSDALVVIETASGWVIGPKTLGMAIDDVTGEVTFLTAGPGVDTGFSLDASTPQTKPASFRAAVGSGAQVQPLGTTTSPNWQLIGNGCWSTIKASSGFGTLDACYKMWKLFQEYDLRRDDFLIEAWATIRGSSGSGLEWATLLSQRYGSTVQTIVDYEPDASTSGGCRTIPLGLGLSAGGNGGSISSAFTACESLDVTIIPANVYIAETWDYCQNFCFQGMLGTRTLKTQLWSSVAENKVPVWQIGYNLG
jgi:hypothetical protein